MAEGRTAAEMSADNELSVTGASAVSQVNDVIHPSMSSSHPDPEDLTKPSASGPGGRFRKNAELVIAARSIQHHHDQLRRSKSYTALGRTFSGLRGRRVNRDDEAQAPAVDKTLIYDRLRPLFRCMTAVGVCFVRRPQPPLISGHDHQVAVKPGVCGRRPVVNRALVMSVVVCIVLAANWARSLSFLQVGAVHAITPTELLQNTLNCLCILGLHRVIVFIIGCPRFAENFIFLL